MVDAFEKMENLMLMVEKGSRLIAHLVALCMVRFNALKQHEKLKGLFLEMAAEPGELWSIAVLAGLRK